MLEGWTFPYSEASFDGFSSTTETEIGKGKNKEQLSEEEMSEIRKKKKKRVHMKDFEDSTRYDSLRCKVNL